MEIIKYIIKCLSAFVITCMMLLFSLQLDAQSHITFKGRILDSQTNEPLPFATITILQSKTSIVSNEFGEFQYHLPENSENSVVQISFIGYKTIKLNVSGIKSGIMTTFKMEPQSQQLQEIEITGTKSRIQAVDIVDKAIRNIRKNYPKSKALLYGYYRDYISPAVTPDYKNLIEAAVVIEDRGFQTDDFRRSKVMLEQLRYNPTVEIDSSLNMAYDGKNKFIPNVGIAAANELSILRAHDPIRNHKIQTFSYVEIFDSQFTLNHKFHFESITEVDSVKTYCIRFDKYHNDFLHQSEYRVDGQIIISSKSFAILKFNYTITCATPYYSGKFLDIKLEYKNYNDKYYLNYLSLMNYFVFKNNFYATSSTKAINPFFQYRELFINKIVNEPFEDLQPAEAIKKDASLLMNKIPVKEGFWENYNYTGISKLLE